MKSSLEILQDIENRIEVLVKKWDFYDEERYYFEKDNIDTSSIEHEISIIVAKINLLMVIRNEILEGEDKWLN